MCDATSVLTTVGGIAAGVVLPMLLGGMNKGSDSQQQMAAPALTPPPAPAAQTGQSPGFDTFMAANKKAEQSAYGGGVNSTFLTGSAGVDPMSLNLGVNTLLGQ